MTASAPLRATAADLPPAVAAALAAGARSPLPSRPLEAAVGSMTIAGRAWDPDPAAGPATGRTTLLLHGVLNSSRGWWRIGPALAATGDRVVALDLPGHGRSRGWTGGIRFADTAGIVAGAVRALGLDATAAPGPTLAVIGHSWGSMIAAALPGVGLAPRRIVLLDPPHLPSDELRALLASMTDRPFPTAEGAAAWVAAENPEWPAEEVAVKAEQLTQVDAARVVEIVLGNDWDGGFGALERARDAGYDLGRYRVVRGVPAQGGMVPDATAERLGALLGPAGIITLDAPHTPHRTHAEPMVLGLLRALA